jgi:PAS domain-containing protein
MENGNAFIEMIHPDDRAAYEEAVGRSAGTMETFSRQWRKITPSGNIKWLQGKSRPKKRENGAIAWHGVVVDITEQKRVERDLQQALNQIENHFENTPLAIIQWESGDRLLRRSKQAERMFGRTKEEMEGVFRGFIY